MYVLPPLDFCHLGFLSFAFIPIPTMEAIREALAELGECVSRTKQVLNSYGGQLRPYNTITHLIEDNELWKPKKKKILSRVSWALGNEPSKAVKYVKSSKAYLPLNLEKKIFQGPVFLSLMLPAENSDEFEQDYRLTIIGGTLGDILTAIHTCYKMHEEKYGYCRTLFFTGLDYYSPGVWLVDTEG